MPAGRNPIPEWLTFEYANGNLHEVLFRVALSNRWPGCTGAKARVLAERLITGRERHAGEGFWAHTRRTRVHASSAVALLSVFTVPTAEISPRKQLLSRGQAQTKKGHCPPQQEFEMTPVARRRALPVKRAFLTPR